ncbi:hypothetical protein NLU13_0620 [Sarocladium strictum]|uniref:Uncharacterized protein n=1 Tax=Sarocladium strictum TaxID=5046 RepID=A0AA39GPD9_SARSR|nr:hypothetical protein NLU13_0620 [Sarocladium strictum]
MSSSTPQQPPGPPYASHFASLGGRPSVVPDVPVAAVLLLFYIVGAALNMYFLRTNLKRGHKFIISGAIFGFCMTRITALVMRIVWSNYPTNVSIAIATSVFTNAGVIIFFVVNIILAQRILRAHHPEFGWRKELKVPFIFIYFSFFACLALLIPSIVYSSFTLDQDTLSKLREIRLFASTYLAVLTFVPIPIVLGAILIPHNKPIDDFGKKGSMRTRVALVLFTATLLCIGATYRACVGYTRRPLTNPGWFNHKAAFYCFNFAIEIIVLYAYTLSRFDLRFHIPNGSSAPGHYSQGGPAGKDDVTKEAETADMERRGSTEAERERNWETQLDNELPPRGYEMAETR